MEWKEMITILIERSPASGGAGRGKCFSTGNRGTASFIADSVSRRVLDLDLEFEC